MKDYYLWEGENTDAKTSIILIMAGGQGSKNRHIVSIVNLN